VIGEFFIDWPLLGVSLFNTILLIWLSLTVFLSAEHRTSGVWIISSGSMMGALFFISHTVILGLGLETITTGIEVWWRVGWIPLVLTPLSWYVSVLWYAGFWETTDRRLYHRHRVWLYGLSGTAFLLALAVFFPGLIPSLLEMTLLNLKTVLNISEIPLIFPVSGIFVFFCIGASFDALLRPGSTTRALGKQARERARPWLFATAFGLLFVSLLVAVVFLWTVLTVRVSVLDISVLRTIAIFDLVIAAFVGISILTLGQAIVAYEIFTGYILPRRGLRRQWQRAVIFAFGYGVVVGGALAYPVQPIYTLLLTAVLMTGFFVLLNWRSFLERERFMRQLRPFITSQRMYDRLLSPSTQQTNVPELDVQVPFTALCEDLLGVRLAVLRPIGFLAPSIAHAITYPQNADISSVDIQAIVKKFVSPDDTWIPLHEPGFIGAIPLWSERGLIGVFLLGEKWDGGLFSQEDIEIARTVGERLVDTQATAVMARRFMSLQRRQLTESKIIDGRTRRTLHDEILPEIHAILLAFDADPQPVLADRLASLHRQISNLLREMPQTTMPEFQRKGLLHTLKLETDTAFSGAFDDVQWDIAEDTDSYLKELSPLKAEVLFYAAREVIRNAFRYGISENKKSNMRVATKMIDGFEIVIEDNGGVPFGAQNGQNGHTAGAGQGLALHSTMMAIVGGKLTFEQRDGEYTRVTLSFHEENV